MNKIMKTALAALLVFPMLTSCYEDKGNYDYLTEEEAMPIKIVALEDVTVKANSLLTIAPQVTGEDGGKFKYLWYTVAQGYPYDTDTLSEERDLSVNVPLKVGKYTLYYKITNEANGVYKYVQAPMTVTASDVAVGWYVLKTGDKGVDFDYFSLSGKNDKADFLTSVLGREQGLEGTPVGLVYMSAGYGHETTNEDGSVTKESNLSAYHVVSSKGYLALNGSDLTVLKDLDEAFYETPATVDMQCIEQDNSNTCVLINNGKCHLLGSIGKWGYQPAGNYELLPNILAQEYDDIVYDTKSKQFYAFDKWNKEMGDCMDLYGTFNYPDIDFQVSHFLSHTDKGFMCDCYCVGYSSVDDKYYVSVVPFMTNYIFGEVEYYEFPSNSLLLQAKVMAAPQSASVIYFAIGNKLYLHRVADGGEDRLVKTFAEGEEVSFIKNITGTDKDGNDFDDVVVLTNTSTGYQVYQFPLNGSAGELHTDVAPVMRGTGKASYLMFRQE